MDAYSIQLSPGEATLPYTELPKYQRDLIDFLRSGRRTGPLIRILRTRQFAEDEIARLRAMVSDAVVAKNSKKHRKDLSR